MATELTDIQKLKLEIGLSGEAEELLQDAEIQYFLDKHKNNIKRASIDAAKTVLFTLSQLVHERTGTELEIWGHTWYENYMQTLKLYLTNPNFNIGFEQAKAYAGGISVADIRSNIANKDNNVVVVDIGVPKDGDARNSTNTSTNVFDDDFISIPATPFNI